MSTPCILAVGTRELWKGVPCKADGAPESTGPVLVDRIVRSASVTEAAKTSVLDAPLGWDWAGGKPLAEEDEFLMGPGLSEKTPTDILDRHYAIYLFNPSNNSLDVKVLPGERWLDPVAFTPTGSVTQLPTWYPQPNLEAEISAQPMSADTKKKLQDFCLKNDIRWNVMLGALRQWCISALGDVSGSNWLFLPSSSEPGASYLRGNVGDVMVFAATDAAGAEFTGSDGKLRHLNVHDVELAEKIFTQIGLRSTHARPALEQWLSAAYETGSGVRGAHVSWYAGIKRWEFETPVGEVTVRGVSGMQVEKDWFPRGWLPTLLSWLFF